MVEGHPYLLAIPLYGLYRIDDASAYIMSDEPLAQMSRDYDEAEIQGIREALEWASEHPEYDFKANLPNVRYCNDDIYRYLVKVLARMKQT